MCMGLARTASARLNNMPYKSAAQRRWAHTRTGTKALGGKGKVAEWDKESKGKKVPPRVARKR